MPGSASEPVTNATSSRPYYEVLLRVFVTFVVVRGWELGAGEWEQGLGTGD